jgi:hypothetical protein
VRGPPWLARQQRAQSERAACSRRQAQGWTASRLACSSRGASAAQPLQPASLKVPRHEGESAHYGSREYELPWNRLVARPSRGPGTCPTLARCDGERRQEQPQQRAWAHPGAVLQCAARRNVAVECQRCACTHPRSAAQRPAGGGPGHEMMRGTRRGWPLSAQRPCSASAPSSRGTLQKRRGSSLLALPRVYTHPHPPSLSPPPSLDPSTATLEPIVALSHRVDVRPLSVHFRHSLILGVLASLNPHPPQPTDAAIYHYHFHYYCYCHYH